MNKLQRANLLSVPLYVLSIVLLCATWLGHVVSALWLQGVLALLPLIGLGFLVFTLFLVFQYAQDEMNKDIWLKSIAVGGVETMLLLVITPYVGNLKLIAQPSEIFLFWIWSILGMRLLFRARYSVVAECSSPTLAHFMTWAAMAAGVLLPFLTLYSFNMLASAVRNNIAQIFLLVLLSIGVVGLALGAVAAYSTLHQKRQR